MRGLRRLLAALVTTTVVAACTHPSTSDGIDGHASGGPARSASPSDATTDIDLLRALPFGDANMRPVTDVLTESGVHVVPDGSPADPTGITLWQWQVRNLAVEAANGGGGTGADLIAIVPQHKGIVPIDYLLAAWVSTYDSPGARFVKDLLGDNDWSRPDTIRFPELALTLFLADATRAAPSSLAEARTVSLHGGPCTAVQGFVDGAITELADLLKVRTSGSGFLGFLGFLGRIWNTAVDLAAGAVRGLIRTLTAPVVNLVADVFTAVGVAQQVLSLVQQWRVSFRATPDAVALGTQSTLAAVIAVVDDHHVELPEALLDCADVVGVDLRRAGSAVSSTVTWDAATAPGALTDTVFTDDEIGEDRTATYRYRTTTESETQVGGDENTGSLAVSTKVARSDVEKLRALLLQVLGAQIPLPARGIVTRLLGPATQQLAALTDVAASTRVRLTYHTADPTKPKPKPKPPIASPAPNLHPATSCPHLGDLGLHYGGAMSVRQGTICAYEDTGTCWLRVSIERHTRALSADDGRPVAVPGVGTGYWGTGTCSPSSAETQDYLFLTVGSYTYGVECRAQSTCFAIARRLAGVA